MLTQAATGPALAWPPGPRLPASGPGGVHVWAAWLPMFPAMSDILSAEENARAQRFRLACDRERWTASRAILRIVLASYVGRAPERLGIRTDSRGKPQLILGDGEPTVRFNLAHAADLMLLAVARDREVGIDVERIREPSWLERLAEMCFTPRERTTWAGVAPAARVAHFFQVWTRKEALVKATGEGLGTSLTRIDTAGGVSESWVVQDLQPASGFTAAVAVEAPLGPAGVSCWAVNALVDFHRGRSRRNGASCFVRMVSSNLKS